MKYLTLSTLSGFSTANLICFCVFFSHFLSHLSRKWKYACFALPRRKEEKKWPFEDRLVRCLETYPFVICMLCITWKVWFKFWTSNVQWRNLLIHSRAERSLTCFVFVWVFFSSISCYCFVKNVLNVDVTCGYTDVWCFVFIFVVADCRVQELLSMYLSGWPKFYKWQVLSVNQIGELFD